MPLGGSELILVGGFGTSLGNAGSLYERSGWIPEQGLPRRPKGPPNNGLNIPILIISAVIFITIVAWYNVLSRIYEDTFIPSDQQGSQYRSTIYALGYAVLITGVSFLIAMIAYNFMPKDLPAPQIVYTNRRKSLS